MRPCMWLISVRAAGRRAAGGLAGAARRDKASPTHPARHSEAPPHFGFSSSTLTVTLMPSERVPHLAHDPQIKGGLRERERKKVIYSVCLQKVSDYLSLSNREIP